MPVTKEKIEETFKSYPFLKYVLYSGGVVLSIWVLGKASKLLTDAAQNFKALSASLNIQKP